MLLDPSVTVKSPSAGAIELVKSAPVSVRPAVVAAFENAVRSVITTNAAWAK